MPAVIRGECLGRQYAREPAAHSASLLLIPHAIRYRAPRLMRPSRAQKLLDAEKTVMKKAALLVANLTLARVKM